VQFGKRLGVQALERVMVPHDLNAHNAMTKQKNTNVQRPQVDVVGYFFCCLDLHAKIVGEAEVGQRMP
jgi:hypothetical protein